MAEGVYKIVEVVGVSEKSWEDAGRIGWFGEGMSSGAHDRLWLVVWTLPVPAIYLWRTRRSPP
jgi:hypothetical protein